MLIQTIFSFLNSNKFFIQDPRFILNHYVPLVVPPNDDVDDSISNATSQHENDPTNLVSSKEDLITGTNDFMQNETSTKNKNEDQEHVATRENNTG